MPDSDKIQYQTNAIKNQIETTASDTSAYRAKTGYQNDMYNSIKFVNQLLLLFYVVLFTVVHGLFLQQYLQGVKRDETQDTIWLSFFFLYPYLIYYVERSIYFLITYLLALIYGQTYVYQFDKLLLFTDYWQPPDPTNKSVLTSSS